MEKRFLILGLFISILLLLNLIFFSYNSCDRCKYDGIDPMFYCESAKDCTLVNSDCSDCSCSNFRSVNKEYALEYRMQVCTGVINEKACDIECILLTPRCVNNQCVK